MKLVDPVHNIVGLFHYFFSSKLISKFEENLGARYFCKTTPRLYFIYVLVPKILQTPLKLFQNYILVHVILYLGP
jgi:hypothetical protein